jgi:multiple sugar transport system ATP-binding protein
MATVKLKNLNKIYPDGFHAVKNLSMEVNDREFVVLVGPSGCGKSTTLRMVAGLETISDGEISIDDVVVNNIPPKDRDIAMVFQNYALYPHMKVYDNMGFGLKLRKFSKEDIKKRVHEAAEILRMTDLLERKPKELSGGQRQRVALGRAIVRKPKVFLFDEPLSNLDAKLRNQMRAEILKLHKRIDATIIYVTHDQVEAMTMGSKIVVMKDGILQQIDKPLSVYNKPENRFIAGFIGSPAMNLIDVKVNGDKLIGKGITISISENGLSSLPASDLAIGIRPEDLRINKEGEFNTEYTGNIDLVEPMGSEIYLHMVNNDQKVIAKVSPDERFTIEEDITLYFDINKAHFFSSDTGVVIPINR